MVERELSLLSCMGMRVGTHPLGQGHHQCNAPQRSSRALSDAAHTPLWDLWSSTVTTGFTHATVESR